MSALPASGEVFIIPYPFFRDTFSEFNGEDYVERSTWRPGVRFEAISPEDVGAVADAVGSATFTVVDTFKPGRFPARVFFTRQFTNPDGHVFGKGKLHIVTLEKFRRLTRGYQHVFGIGEPYDDHAGQRLTIDEFLAELREYTEKVEA